MAYDRELADRVRALVDSEPGLSERRMFGGLAFLLEGRMAVAVSRQGGLLLRVDPAEQDTLAREPHTTAFVMAGRPARGWLRVLPDGLLEDDDLRAWVARGVNAAQELGRDA